MSRKREADRIFIEQHGERASIDRTEDGWVIDPNGRQPNKEAIQSQLSLFNELHEEASKMSLTGAAQ